jgi:hypothetical protein
MIYVTLPPKFLSFSSQQQAVITPIDKICLKPSLPHPKPCWFLPSFLTFFSPQFLSFPFVAQVVGSINADSFLTLDRLPLRGETIDAHGIVK